LLASLLGNAFCIYYLPKSVNTPYFLPLLAFLQVVLFLPLYIDHPSQRFYNNLVKVMLYIFVALQAKVTRDVLLVRKMGALDGEMKGMDGVLQASLKEHPIVSSVGNDAMLSIVAFGLWSFLEGWF